MTAKEAYEIFKAKRSDLVVLLMNIGVVRKFHLSKN